MARTEDLSSSDLLVEYGADGGIVSIHERGGKDVGFVFASKTLTGGIKELTMAGETLASFVTMPGDEVAGVTAEV